MSISINYSIGEHFIEGFMIDKCSIVRDPPERFDEVLDEVTGKLIAPVPDGFEVYFGACLFKHPKANELPTDIGGEPTDIRLYKVLLPITVQDVRFGDYIHVVSSRDLATGTKLRIEDVTRGTHVTYRAVYAKDITNAR